MVPETAYDVEREEHVQASDFLEETDPNDSQNDNQADGEHEEILFFSNSQEFEELTSEEVVTDLKTDNRSEASEEKFICYEASEETAAQLEEVPCEDSYVSESQRSGSSEIDSWLSGVKETMMVRTNLFDDEVAQLNPLFQTFPNLLRARAKKQINDLVSEFEIRYLESIDVDQK